MIEKKDKLKHLILNEIGFREAIKLIAEIQIEERTNLESRSEKSQNRDVKTELYNRSLKMGSVEIYDKIFDDCSATFYEFSFGH